MKLRMILIGAGVLAALIVVRLVLALPTGPASEDVAVDTTGASAQAAASSGPVVAGAPTAEPTPEADKAAPAATTTTELRAAEPTADAVVVQVQGTPVRVERKPLLLLNPTTVRQGSSIGVTGSGFDAGATVDLVLKQRDDDKGNPLTFVQVDKSGGFGGLSFPVPDALPRGSIMVEASQRNSDKVARATAVVAGGSPQVKLGTQVGKAGDTIVFSAEGFAPDEDVDVCWNTLQNAPVTIVHTDGNGAIRQAAIPVPFGAVGNNAFVFVGKKSQSPVSIPFQLLNLYPSVELSSYAIKPDNVLTVSGKDFGPGERVLIYLNSPDSSPITSLQADANGAFSNAGGMVVPFGLRGKQTLIYVGEQSRAPTTASFDILPYTPSVQPSTYGGRPGTALAFYATDFARNEVVHAYLGRTRDNPGREVTCFLTDAQGNAGAAGSYIIPGNAQAGQLIFTLVGSKSQAAATAALDVIASDVPVQVPAQPEFKCPLDGGSGTTSPTAAQPSATTRGNAAAPTPTATATPGGARGVTTSRTPVTTEKPTVAAGQPTATPQPTPTSQPVVTPQPQASRTTADTPTPSAEVYTVQSGDTLSSIARRFYGDPDQWRRISDANQDLLGGKPNSLKPGMSLEIPPAGAE